MNDHTNIIEGIDPSNFTKDEMQALDETGAYLSSLGRNLGYNIKVHLFKRDEAEKEFMQDKLNILIADETDTQFKAPIILVATQPDFSKPIGDREMKSLVEDYPQANNTLADGFKAMFQKYQTVKEFHTELAASLSRKEEKKRTMKM